MRHPFEHRASIVWLATLVAILAGYLVATLPGGLVAVSEAQTTVQSESARLVEQDSAASGHEPPPVPMGALIVGMAFGVIALVVSLGNLVTIPIRTRQVRWVGPRSSTM